MIIEESILIRAGMDRVWRTFSDLSCWKHWNSVLEGVSHDEESLIEPGRVFRCWIRPFVFPIRFQPVVEEVIPFNRVVWSGSRFGISARHAYLFQRKADGVRVVSHEVFSGIVTLLGRPFIPWGRLRALTIGMLEDLKREAESLSPIDPAA